MAGDQTRQHPELERYADYCPSIRRIKIGIRSGISKWFVEQWFLHIHCYNSLSMMRGRFERGKNRGPGFTERGSSMGMTQMKSVGHQGYSIIFVEKL